MEDLDTKLRRRTPDEQPHDDFGEERRVELIDVGPRGRRRSVVIPSAILLFSIVFHVAFFLCLPKGTPGVRKPPTPQQMAQAKARNKEVKIHLVRSQPRKAKLPEDDQPQIVMSTNAPENKPDSTRNTSSKNQQLAQKIVSKNKNGNAPQVEHGEKIKASGLEKGELSKEKPTVSQIVEESRNNTSNPKNHNGNEAQQAKQPKGGARTSDEEAAPAMPKALLSEKPRADGKGVAEFEKSGDANKIPEKAPKDREIPAVVSDNPYVRMEQPKVEASPSSGMRPRPRPRLSIPSARPEPLRLSDSGVERVENYVSMDSAASDYGNYMERMHDVIGARFSQLIERAGSQVTGGDTEVKLSFTLDKDGQVDDVKVVESTATQKAQWICIDALKGSAPFFPWTQDMITRMGPRTSLTWEFDFL